MTAAIPRKHGEKNEKQADAVHGQMKADPQGRKPRAASPRQSRRPPAMPTACGSASQRQRTSNQINSERHEGDPSGDEFVLPSGIRARASGDPGQKAPRQRDEDYPDKNHSAPPNSILLQHQDQPQGDYGAEGHPEGIVPDHARLCPSQGQGQAGAEPGHSPVKEVHEIAPVYAGGPHEGPHEECIIKDSQSPSRQAARR